MEKLSLTFRYIFGYNIFVAKNLLNLCQTLQKNKRSFDFINIYISENGISPTIEEIKKKLKLKAVSTVHEHINSLKNKAIYLNLKILQGV